MPLRVAVFSTKSFDRDFLNRANQEAGHELRFLEARLEARTAKLAESCNAICAFVNDDVGAATVDALAEVGVRLIALRSAGFNHVDLDRCVERDITVARVPAYSPHAVAEHAVALLLAVNRKIHRAYGRVRDANYTLGGLMGTDLVGKTVGVVGTGSIGAVFARIMLGFGCEVVAMDPFPDESLTAAGIRYVDFDELCRAAHVISLHCPLTPDTRHLIDADALAAMRDEVILVNTSRGALVDTRALIDSLKRGKPWAVGLDVYEEEEGLFFEDHSDEIPTDDQLSRLTTFPNVLITAHQAFFTQEALTGIATTTIGNLNAFETGDGELHTVVPERSS